MKLIRKMDPKLGLQKQFVSYAYQSRQGFGNNLTG
jgi:hypothetical protein